eukprot:TRINITY_DN27117_c0_g1_i1.p1 TRINITY_DN27117_c0_g1~~TRINITY_DN27117_c0_g1_i1.p1  ORF type:complete len:114 (-),score=11.62 TRINITY_DN27117_c0_g1_i1:118-459(-)
MLPMPRMSLALSQAMCSLLNNKHLRSISVSAMVIPSWEACASLEFGRHHLGLQYPCSTSSYRPWPPAKSCDAPVTWSPSTQTCGTCLLYTSDAADEEDSVDLGGRRIIKKKKK